MPSPATLVRASACVALSLPCLLIAKPAQACGLAYPQGSYARLADERAVVVWDGAHHTEHFLRRPTFLGDAKTFGFFVPTPVAPNLGKVPPEVLDKVARLVASLEQVGTAGSGASPEVASTGVEVLQRVVLDGFELVTLKATSGDELGTWLKGHGFVDRASLRAWADGYLKRGWVVNAMRYAGAPAAAKLEAPVVRFSFPTDVPFYPYSEPTPEPEDEAAFSQRLGVFGVPARELHLWVVSDGPVEAFQGDHLSGPYLHGSAKVDAKTVAGALGDTKAWGFDPFSRGTWHVSYLNQHEERSATADVELRQGRVLLDDAAATTARALAASGHEFLAPAPSSADLPSPRGHRRRWALGLLALVAAGAAAFGLASAKANEKRAPHSS